MSAHIELSLTNWQARRQSRSRRSCNYPRASLVRDSSASSSALSVGTAVDAYVFVCRVIWLVNGLEIPSPPTTPYGYCGYLRYVQLF